MGAWDCNPAIFIRSRQPFEAVAYHLRKFIHLYSEQNEKWYFFRFYNPVILVAYLRYIARSPAKLASFFGVRNGQAVIDAFAARVGNRFYTFGLSELPQDTPPGAIGYDKEFEQFLADYDKRQLLEKLQKEIIPAEFPAQKIPEPEIEKCFHNTLELGFKTEGGIISLVKILCCLSGDIAKLKHYWKALEKEYGNDLTEIEIGELLYEKIKTTMKSQE